MFNSEKNDRSPSWYPGAQAIKDRWGTKVNADVTGREFRPAAQAIGGDFNTLRWSLGLM